MFDGGINGVHKQCRSVSELWVRYLSFDQRNKNRWLRSINPKKRAKAFLGHHRVFFVVCIFLARMPFTIAHAYNAADLLQHYTAHLQKQLMNLYQIQAQFDKWTSGIIRSSTSSCHCIVKPLQDTSIAVCLRSKQKLTILLDNLRWNMTHVSCADDLKIDKHIGAGWDIENMPKATQF